MAEPAVDPKWKDPFSVLTLEQQKELAAYYIKVRDLLDGQGREMNVLTRVDDTFIWVVPQDLSNRQLNELYDVWAERCPGKDLLIFPRTVFLPRMDILYSAQPRPNPGAS